MQDKSSKLPPGGLYAVTSGGHADSTVLADRVRAAIRGGARMIQYRAKEVSTETRLIEALSLLAVCDEQGVPLIINDDVALAAGIGAAGVHLGADDATPALARAVLGPEAIIGVSCHGDLERARQGRDAGADYLAFGSFFPSRSKPSAFPAPVEILVQAGGLGLPVVAIGGITPDNGPHLIQAGADFLAVISGVFDQLSPERAARAYAALFE